MKKWYPIVAALLLGVSDSPADPGLGPAAPHASGSEISALVDPSVRAPIEFELERVIETTRGSIEVRNTVHEGRLVLGSREVVRRDEAGNIVWRGGNQKDLGSLRPPLLNANEAVEHASLGAPLQVEPIVWAVGTRRPRHAYRMVYPPSDDLRTQWRVTLSAEDGAVLSRENLVRSAKGHVYGANPVETPELIEVDLPTTGDSSLENDRFVMANCEDTRRCEDVYPSMCRLGCDRSRPAQMNPSEIEGVLAVANISTFEELDQAVGLDARAARNIVEHRETHGEFVDVEALDAIAFVAETAFAKILTYAYETRLVANSAIHFCEMAPRATPNASGDYLHIMPADDAAEDDAFAEVHVFHHLNLVDDITRSWGFSGLPDERVRVIVNYRGADEYDDASYACTDGVFAGDGELELVENAWYAPRQLAGEPALVFGQGAAIDWGLDADIVYHEYGHAVMFAVAPDVGDGTWDAYGFNRSQAGLHEGYADLLAMWLTDGDAHFAEYVGAADRSEALRDWSKPVRCPRDMTGEEHDDGLILPSAVWHARQAISADARAEFDEAGFVVWLSLGADDGLRTVVDRLKDEFAFRRPDEAAVATEVLDTFITSDCETRTVDAWTSKDLAIQGNDYFEIAPYGVPHTLQWRARLATPASEVSFLVGTVDATDPGNPVDMTLFMKRGDTPIQWIDEVNGDYVTDADLVVPVSVEGGVASATIREGFGTGTYTFALANRGGSAYLWDTVFDSDGEGLKDDSVATGSPQITNDDGCSASGGTRGPTPWAVLLLALTLLRRR